MLSTFIYGVVNTIECCVAGGGNVMYTSNTMLLTKIKLGRPVECNESVSEKAVCLFSSVLTGRDDDLLS